MARVSVEDYLADLVHARFDEVLTARAAVLAADPETSERIKWNAPSITAGSSSHEVTFRLQPRDALQLILHRGAGVRDDGAELASELADPHGLVEWAAPDRGVVTLSEHVDAARANALTELAGAWFRLGR